jgi:iron(II)-dependent oxidoreductase
VKLSPFFIDRYPATNGQYKECYDAGECPPTCHQEQSCLGGHYSDNDMTDPLLAEYPVSTITIQGAEAYCRWKGKRLPTEAEWERAARGPKSFDYPWGNAAPDCTHTICNPTDVPAGWFRFYFPKVGTNPGDVSPEGVHDMLTSSTNIMYDDYDPGYYKDTPFENPPGAS